MVSVDSRVMLNTNPDYNRPQPKELVKKKTDNDGWADIFSESSCEGSFDRIKGNDVEPAYIKESDLLIYCPTVQGFPLRDKLWRMIIFNSNVVISLIRWCVVEFAVAHID